MIKPLSIADKVDAVFSIMLLLCPVFYWVPGEFVAPAWANLIWWSWIMVTVLTGVKALNERTKE